MRALVISGVSRTPWSGVIPCCGPQACPLWERQEHEVYGFEDCTQNIRKRVDISSRRPQTYESGQVQIKIEGKQVMGMARYK